MSWGNEHCDHIISDLISLHITWPGACEVWARTGAAMRLRGPGRGETEPRLRPGPCRVCRETTAVLQTLGLTMGSYNGHWASWLSAKGCDEQLILIFHFPVCIATHSPVRVVITVSMPGVSIITMSVSEVTISLLPWCMQIAAKRSQYNHHLLLKQQKL